MGNEARDLNSTTSSSESGTPGNTPSLQDRVVSAFRRAKEILTFPGIWPTLRDEQKSVEAIYREYLLILAAVGPIAMFLKSLMIGAPLFSSIFYHLILYVFNAASIYVAAFVVSKIAPNFGGSGDTNRAFKLVAYSCTPAYLAGAFVLIPWIGGILSLVGIYSLYLLYQNAPSFLSIPKEKNPTFCLVAILGAGVTCAVLAAVVFGIALMFGIRPYDIPGILNEDFDLRRYK